MRLWLATLLCISLNATSSAQVRPQAGPGDPRLQTIDYNPGEVVQLEGAPGYQLMVELSPDEQVLNVALGDASAWQVSVNHAGDHLFIKPTQVGVATNMTVITTVRTYNFELDPVRSPMADMPYNVRFQYPADDAEQPKSEYVDVSPLRRALSRYRITGDVNVKPDSITDDGEHTYISWSPAKPIPAVFTIGDGGQETLVSGWMRGDVYVIDAIVNRLTFRIDDHVARAQRLSPRKTF